MTKRRRDGLIDVDATNEQALRDAYRTLTERFHRELRYNPNFHGVIELGLIVEQGLVKRLTIAPKDNRLVKPIQ